MLFKRKKTTKKKIKKLLDQEIDLLWLLAGLFGKTKKTRILFFKVLAADLSKIEIFKKKPKKQFSFFDLHKFKIGLFAFLAVAGLIGAGYSYLGKEVNNRPREIQAQVVDACGTASITDNRGSETNVYPVVSVGSGGNAQCWMAENLRAAKYPDGSQIASSTNWSNSNPYYACPPSASNQADCNSAINGTPKLGYLYRWSAAMNGATNEGAQGICPNGWHIPTDAEWKTLEMSLGMTQAQASMTSFRGTDQGSRLKVSGSSGLNIPLAGIKTSTGSYSSRNTYSYLWSSTIASNVWIRMLSSSEARIWRNSNGPVNFGYNLRCLKNPSPIRSNGQVNGSPSPATLSFGTTQVTISLSTNEPATCKYSTSDIPYDSMSDTFTTTGGTAQSTLISGLTNFSSYSYHIKCMDASANNNKNTDDFTINFTVEPDTTPAASVGTIKKTSDCGFIEVTNNPVDSAVLKKKNSSGVEQWSVTTHAMTGSFPFSHNNLITINDVLEDSTGNIVVVGNSNNSIPNGRRVYIAKFRSSDGVRLDELFYGDSDSFATSILETASSYLIVGGYWFSGGNYNSWFIRVNKQNIQTVEVDKKNYIGSNADNYASYSIQPTNDGNYIAIGNTDCTGAADCKIYLAKLDINGNVLGSPSYPWSGRGTADGSLVMQDSSGNYLGVGYTPDASWSYHPYLLKFNSSLALQAQKSDYSISYAGGGGYIEQMSDGNYGLSTLEPNGSGGYNFHRRKFDANNLNFISEETVAPTCGICGNGLVEGAEQCDSGNLNGQTCVSQGFNAGGTLSCNGSCSFNTGACVSDTVPPVISNYSDLTIEAANASGAAATYTPIATDAISGNRLVACNPLSGSNFAIGTTQVKCSATDAVGNYAEVFFNVTVRDSIAPAISAHSDVLAESPTGVSISVTYTMPTATDAVGVTSLSCAPDSGSTFPMGTSTVVCTARDAANNTTTSFFRIIVQDTASPDRYGGGPSGYLPASTTQAVIFLSTVEAAVCQYSTSAGVAYSSMPNIFSTTGGTYHTKLITGLTFETNYTYYVRCTDARGNANPDDYIITFYVSSPYKDIGLRAYSGGKIVNIAVDPAVNSPLRISRDGIIYNIKLIDTGAPKDSGIRIKVGASTKALRIYPTPP